uniref:Uncharacterized protein n=1 Tax=Globodera rostochiensis TaxID=31243 RepID=A0A914IFY5_GLORO
MEEQIQKLADKFSYLSISIDKVSDQQGFASAATTTTAHRCLHRDAPGTLAQQQWTAIPFELMPTKKR